MHYLEFGGGLGDVVNQCYLTGNYAALDHLEQVTPILILCHNRFCREIFTQHPKHELFDLLDVRYGGYPAFPDGFDEVALRHELAASGYTVLHDAVAPRRQDVVFHPGERDRPVLDALPAEFIAFQPFGGTSDRDLPLHIIEAVDDCAARLGVPLVVIGRNYERIGKDTREAFTSAHAATNCIDQLSVPGTIALVQRASLFVGSHSSMNIVAWHNRVPNYILFPEHIRDKHFRPGQRDDWSFGRDYPETRLDLFSAFSAETIARLLAIDPSP